MNLQHHFLIAMPALQDPIFRRSVVYICEHNENGAMGDAVHDILLSDPWITRDGDILILESPAGRLTLVRT